MAEIFYKYKIRASVRADCEEYERLSAELAETLRECRFVPLGNGEYGTNELIAGQRAIDLLWKNDRFIDSAAEFIWFDSVAAGGNGTYDEDDMLSSALKYRNSEE